MNRTSRRIHHCGGAIIADEGSQGRAGTMEAIRHGSHMLTPYPDS
ncbi:CTP synthase [Brucella sp. NF 2653]|nr:CTP synthase [Brucella sp. NF 2653]